MTIQTIIDEIKHNRAKARATPPTKIDNLACQNTKLIAQLETALQTKYPERSGDRNVLR